MVKPEGDLLPCADNRRLSLTTHAVPSVPYGRAKTCVGCPYD